MADDHNGSDKINGNRLRFLQEAGQKRRHAQQATAGQAKSFPLPQKLETYSQKLKAIRALRKGQWMLYCGYGALYGACNMAGHWFFHRHVDWTDFVTVGFLVPIGFVLRSSGARISRQALEALSRERDTQTIGHIINTLGSYMLDWQSEIMAQNALLQLLPRLTMEEASRLGILQRRFLYNRVKYGKPEQDGELMIALLDTFERLGDTRAIPAVRKLLQRDVQSGKATRVKEKARRCLAALIERSEQAQADTTLLRAVDSPEPSTEGLLRPATSTQEDPPQLLLRPHGEADK